MRANKVNWILISTILVVYAIGDVPNAFGQEVDEKRERKIEIKKMVTDEGESIFLRVEKADGSLYEKSYSSEAEMRNDPELKDLDLSFGDTDDFLFRTGENQDGKFEVIIQGEDGKKSNKVIMLSSEEGSVQELIDGDVEIIEDFEGGNTFNYFFKNDGGDTFKILKDENGEIQIEKNGELMNIEELQKDGQTKVDVGEDGTITISEGDKNHQNVMIFKNSGGEFTMNLSDDFDWKSDSLVNKFIVGEPDQSEDGTYVLRMDVETDVDGDGNQQVFIHKKVEKITVEIQDVSDFEEINEVPGLLLQEGRDLSLEEVDYYPNPSQGKFNLKFKGKKRPIQIKILDLRGQEIFVENINDFSGMYDNQINLSGNEPGLYVLQVIQNNKSWTKKIVIE